MRVDERLYTLPCGIFSMDSITYKKHNTTPGGCTRRVAILLGYEIFSVLQNRVSNFIDINTWNKETYPLVSKILPPLYRVLKMTTPLLYVSKCLESQIFEAFIDTATCQAGCCSFVLLTTNMPRYLSIQTLHRIYASLGICSVNI